MWLSCVVFDASCSPTPALARSSQTTHAKLHCFLDLPTYVTQNSLIHRRNHDDCRLLPTVFDHRCHWSGWILSNIIDYYCPEADPSGRTVQDVGLRLRLLGLWVRIPPGAWMSVCFDCCVLSGRGF